MNNERTTMYIVNGGNALVSSILHQLKISAKLKVLYFENRH